MDWIRVLALILVVLHHLGFPNVFLRDNGWIGMDILFALSSYFLTKSIIENPNVSLKRLFLKRILTLWPLYFFYLLVIGHFDQTWPYMLFMGNWWVIKHGWSEFNLIGHMWALSLIEQFYFGWAFILSRINKQHIVKVVVVGLIVSFFAKLFLFVPGNFYPVYMNTIARLDPFLWGALLAVTSIKIPRLVSSLFLVFGTIVLMFVNIREGNLLTVLLGYPLIGIASMLLLQKGIDIVNNNSKLVSDISKWGFGIYIWQKIVIELATRITDNQFLIITIVLIITVAVAALTYNFIQKPFIKLKTNINQ